MTREEAIRHIRDILAENNSIKSSMVVFEIEKEALDMAIKALEQQPCDDCISREKAKQFLYERIDRLNDDELYDIFSRIIDDMYNELPPAIPKAKTETGH